MPSPDPVNLVQELVEGFHESSGKRRVRGTEIPLSAVLEAVRSSLETGPFFPPHLRPDDLGDGAVIERRGKRRYRVHERFETGQLRFSDLKSRDYFFLRSAVLRYLGHYRDLLRLDKVRIRRWA